MGPDLSVRGVSEILDAISDAAMLLDGQGRVAVTNAAASTYFGAWVKGQSYISVLRQPALLEPVEDAFFHRKEGRARFVHLEGEVETQFDVKITPLPALAERGRAPVLLVFRDDSDLSAGAAMRADFVANVSHELKTPLTAALGFIETVLGPARDDAATRERFLHLTAQELSRMSRLVSDLLSLSRLEERSRQRPETTLDLVPLLSEAVELLDAVAQDVNVRLTVDAVPEAPAKADRDQILQVLTNLIENGIKYGARPGQVRIALTEVPHEPVIRGPAWRLAVTDEGAGVAPEHLPRLTERFYRVDAGRSRTEGGTGLGLAIVKHIVNRHRGRLRIESALGRGTTVTIILPMAQGAAEGETGRLTSRRN